MLQNEKESAGHKGRAKETNQRYGQDHSALQAEGKSQIDQKHQSENNDDQANGRGKKDREHIAQDDGMKVLPYAFTGPEIAANEAQIGSEAVGLIQPKKRQETIESIKKAQGQFVCVDYTHPDAVNDNAVFYCNNRLPFVMGTTGGNRQLLLETVEKSEIAAVIAPNMAKQIVAFQAMMEYAAKTFPDLPCCGSWSTGCVRKRPACLP